MDLDGVDGKELFRCSSSRGTFMYTVQPPDVEEMKAIVTAQK